MDWLDKQQDSLKTLSKTLLLVLAFLAVASTYVLQREVDVIFGLINAAGVQPQAVYQGLNFEYRTMSVAWPCLIGVGLLFSNVLSEKRTSVFDTLAAKFPPLGVLASDPWHFAVPRSRFIRAVFSGFASFLPLLALVVTVISAAMYLDRDPELSLIRAACAVFGLCCIRKYWLAVKSFWAGGVRPSPSTEPMREAEQFASEIVG